jgi:photosystem I subunit 10
LDANKPIYGDKSFMMSHLILVAAAVPTTVSWNLKVAVVMVICNIIAIAFGKATIKQQNVGPALPSPNLFGGMGLGALLGTTSFGHILGVGAILGLSNLGVL